MSRHGPKKLPGSNSMTTIKPDCPQDFKLQKKQWRNHAPVFAVRRLKSSRLGFALTSLV
jgi:hypothetical protein